MSRRTEACELSAHAPFTMTERSVWFCTCGHTVPYMRGHTALEERAGVLPCNACGFPLTLLHKGDVEMFRMSRKELQEWGEVVADTASEALGKLAPNEIGVIPSTLMLVFDQPHERQQSHTLIAWAVTFSQTCRVTKLRGEQPVVVNEPAQFIPFEQQIRSRPPTTRVYLKLNPDDGTYIPFSL